MPLYHVGTFAILGACFFLASTTFFEHNYQLMFAYLTAGFSWVVVAAYEYNERVFNRAIQEIVRRTSSNLPPEE